PVTADPVDVSVVKERRGHDAVQSVRVPFAVLLSLPEDRRALRIRGQLEHEGAFIKSRHEEPIPGLAWCRHTQPGTRRERLRPVDLAGLGFEGVDGFRMPDDELTAFPDLDQRGRTVTGFLGGESPPDFLAGVLVEGHGDTLFTADQANEARAVEQRMGGKAPRR